MDAPNCEPHGLSTPCELCEADESFAAGLEAAALEVDQEIAAVASQRRFPVATALGVAARRIRALAPTAATHATVPATPAGATCSVAHINGEPVAWFATHEQAREYIARLPQSEAMYRIASITPPPSESPTAAHVAWVFAKLVENARVRGSFRHLIYEVMGFEPSDYGDLCQHGMSVNNALYRDTERAEADTAAEDRNYVGTPPPSDIPDDVRAVRLRDMVPDYALAHESGATCQLYIQELDAEGRLLTTRTLDAIRAREAGR